MCLFKIEKYSDALESINRAIETLEQIEDNFAYIWVRGLWYKELDMFELATKDYLYLKSFESPKTLEKWYDENFTNKATLDIIVNNKSSPHVLLTKDFYVEGDGWKHDKLDKASKLINRIPFFKRLTAIHIKAYLWYFEVKTFQANKPIYVPKDMAWVVIGGWMRYFKFFMKRKKINSHSIANSRRLYI